MSEIEKELREACSFKSKPKYPGRADYLADLATKVDTLNDKEFGELSAEARDWHSSAITAINDREDPPEFDDAVVEGEDPVEDLETEVAAENEEDDVIDPVTGEVLDPEEGEPEPRPAKAKVTNKPINPPAAGTRKFRDRPVGSSPKVPIAGKPHGKRPGPHQYAHADRDKYGLVKGSKVSEACKMFEAGCPMSHITKSLGGPQNNILHKLEEAGHRVERYEGVIHLTHKDEVKNKPAASKAPAKPAAKAPAAKPPKGAKAKAA